MPFSFFRLRRSTNRVRQILNVFLKYGFGKVIDQIHLSRFVPFRKRIKSFGQWPSVKEPAVAERLRMAFAELGPSFIKLAQILSSRPDLITKQYADEFKKLQDRVPPFSSDEAKQIIEQDIAKPIDQVFSRFDAAPIAAASIAQVHYATLIDGTEVVVKVQRPRIREQIETDVSILSFIAGLMEKYFPESAFFNPTGIVEEFTRTVRKELDFLEEARNCARFKRNFEQDTDIHIPEVFTQYSTDKIIVMERIDGVRLDDIEGITRLGLDRVKLAKIGVNAYFKQILEDGFFHGDPHAGNIFAMQTGQIAFMDLASWEGFLPNSGRPWPTPFLRLFRKTSTA